MRLALFVFSFLLLPDALDAREKIDLRPAERAKVSEDPGSATRLIYETPKPIPANHPEKDSRELMACTDSVGMIHQKGEPGYVTCLRYQNKAVPEATAERRGQSLGITIGK